MIKALSVVVSLALLAPLFAIHVLAAPTEEQVRNAVNGMAEAWNGHDMEAFGKLFAADADYVNVGGKWTKV
jgi:hypothetical protein